MKHFVFFLLLIALEFTVPIKLQIKHKSKLKNMPQANAGGAAPLYSRQQQAAEHLFLPMINNFATYEHQNPYAIKDYKTERLEAEKDYLENKVNHDYKMDVLTKMYKDTLQNLKPYDIKEPKLTKQNMNFDQFILLPIPVDLKEDQDEQINSALKQADDDEKKQKEDVEKDPLYQSVKDNMKIAWDKLGKNKYNVGAKIPKIEAQLKQKLPFPKDLKGVTPKIFDQIDIGDDPYAERINQQKKLAEENARLMSVDLSLEYPNRKYEKEEEVNCSDENNNKNKKIKTEKEKEQERIEKELQKRIKKEQNCS